MITFDKKLALATLCSLTLTSLFALAPAAHAATNTFDGNNFTVSYGVSNGNPASSPFFETASAPATGGASGIEIASLTGWQIDTMGNSLTLSWNRADDFMNFGSPAFIGFKISDTSNQLSDILGASVTNTTYTPSMYGNLV
ncbi:MAG: hypothetical protein M3Q16_10465, partial [Pseudomonadota bacterium]|nr:hypothetical protein [Pseudomonadota bacterium]